MLTGELPFQFASNKSPSFREYCSSGGLPSEEHIPPPALEDLKLMMAVEPQQRPSMPQVCELPWVASGLQLHGDMQHRTAAAQPDESTDTLAHDTAAKHHDAISRDTLESHNTAETVVSPCSEEMKEEQPTEDNRKRPRAALSEVHNEDSSEAWSGRATAWEIEMEGNAEARPDFDNDDVRIPSEKVRRIGWAIAQPRSSVLEVLQKILQELGVPAEVDATRSRVVAGENGCFTLGVSTDRDGTSQVEWTRTGSDPFELKRIYTSVQNALDRRDGPGMWVHRYGADAVTIH